MLRLLYRSRATAPPNHSDLNALIKAAQERNLSDGLTGLLCYDNGHFIQCLEGPSDILSRTLGRIYRDPRHTDIVIADARFVTSRLFQDWGMKLVRVDELPTDVIRFDHATSAGDALGGQFFADRMLAFLIRAAEPKSLPRRLGISAAVPSQLEVRDGQIL